MWRHTNGRPKQASLLRGIYHFDPHHMWQMTIIDLEWRALCVVLDPHHVTHVKHRPRAACPLCGLGSPSCDTCQSKTESGATSVWSWIAIMWHMSNINPEWRDLCVVLDPHKVRSQDLHAKHLTSYQSDLQRRRDLCIVYDAYGVVPKRWLTFPGSFYKEVAKTTSGALVYRFERQTSKKKNSFFEKNTVFSN